MRGGKNSLRSNICRPDRNTIIRFRLRHTGNDTPKVKSRFFFTTIETVEISSNGAE
jgi:hypothetical protein